MNVRQTISLESADAARISCIEQVFCLLGGVLDDAALSIQGRFKANAFSLDDVWVLGEAVYSVQSHPVPETFTDAVLQAGIVSGTISGRSLALRQYQAFVDGLQEDFAVLGLCMGRT
jgi:hypothetical protein